jgi:hypothetical protein
MLPDRRRAATRDVLADRPDDGQGGLDVQLGPRQDPGQLTGAQGGCRLATKINSD